MCGISDHLFTEQSIDVRWPALFLPDTGIRSRFTVRSKWFCTTEEDKTILLIITVSSTVSLARSPCSMQKQPNWRLCLSEVSIARRQSILSRGLNGTNYNIIYSSCACIYVWGDVIYSSYHVEQLQCDRELLDLYSHCKSPVKWIGVGK